MLISLLLCPSPLQHSRKDSLLNDPDYRWQTFTGKKYKSMDWELANEVSETLNRLFKSVDVHVDESIREPRRRFLKRLELLEEKLGILYGGSFVDVEEGIIYIGLVKLDEKQKSKVLEIMRPSPRIKVLFYETKFTMRRLEEAVSRLIEAWFILKESGIPIIYIDACEVRNKLVIGLDYIDEMHKRAIRQIVEEDIIEFIETDPPTLDTAQYSEEYR